MNGCKRTSFNWNPISSQSKTQLKRHCRSFRDRVPNYSFSRKISTNTWKKGIYTVDIFTKRNAALAKEIKQLQFSEADLLRQRGDGDDKKAGAQLIPTAQHILDSYPSLTVEEKNQLWRLVLDKVTVYRSQDGELTVHLYPKLPGK